MNGKLAIIVGIALAGLGAALWLGLQGATVTGASDIRAADKSAAANSTTDADPTGRSGPNAATARAPTLPMLDCAHPNGPVATIDAQALAAEPFCKELKQLGVALRPGAADKSSPLATELLGRLIDVALVDVALASEHTAVTLGEMESDLAPRGLHAVAAAVAPNAPQDLVELDLRRQGVDPDYLREQVRRRLALRKLVDLRGDVSVSRDQIAAELQAHPERQRSGTAATVRAFVARLAPTTTAEQVAAAEQGARQFADAARAGGEAEAAPRLKMQAMPPFDLETPSSEPELEKAAFALQPQQWSAPIRTRTGFVVVQLVAKKEGRERPPAEVEAEIASQLRVLHGIAEQKRLVAALRAAAKIRVLVDLGAAATPR